MLRGATIHLVRHGAEHNPQQIHYGRLPGHQLGEDGTRHAAAAAAALKGRPLSAIFASQLERDMQTARTNAAWHPGLDVEPSDLLLEVSVPYEGWTFREIESRNWDLFSGNQPPHETADDVLSRGLQFLTLARRTPAQTEVAAVTHRDVIALLMLWTRGAPFQPEERLPLYCQCLGTGSISTLSFAGTKAAERPTVASMRPEW